MKKKTLNVQRPTPNIQLSELSVERWSEPDWHLLGVGR
jgi:hypothetical protein